MDSILRAQLNLTRLLHLFGTPSLPPPPLSQSQPLTLILPLFLAVLLTILRRNYNSKTNARNRNLFNLRSSELGNYSDEVFIEWNLLRQLAHKMCANIIRYICRQKNRSDSHDIGNGENINCENANRQKNVCVCRQIDVEFYARKMLRTAKSR